MCRLILDDSDSLSSFTDATDDSTISEEDSRTNPSTYVHHRISSSHSLIDNLLQRTSVSSSVERLGRSRPPSIVSLAENYRHHYLKMLHETMGINRCMGEKRPLTSPTAMITKRLHSSSTTNLLRTLRNQIRDEDDEQFYFNTERQM
jgi:hypothetical protein